MAKKITNAPLFQLFWENSKLNTARIFKFAENLQADASQAPQPDKLNFAAPNIYLKNPGDKLARIFRKRSSGRDFLDKPLSIKQLGGLFSAFGQKSGGLRVNASAGGKYPVEIFAFLLNVKSGLGERAVYYNPDSHALSELGGCPKWATLQPLLNFESKTAPAAVILFVGFPDRMTRKYGERGGRFLLLEAGGMMQSLGLRAAQEGLKGVLVGGGMDDDIIKLLKLNDSGALLIGAYLCGN